MLTATKIHPQIWQLVAFTEVINNWHHTRMSVAFSRRHTHAGMVPVVLQEARNSMKQRGRQEDRKTDQKMGHLGKRWKDVCLQTVDQFRDAVQIVIVWTLVILLGMPDIHNMIILLYLII